MTLKEMQDARAYARGMIDTSDLSMFEQTYGEAMRWLSKVEKQPTGLPSIRKASGLAIGEKRRSERVLDVLRANGPLTRLELASALGISYSSVFDYARPLLATGEIGRSNCDNFKRYFARPAQ